MTIGARLLSANLSLHRCASLTIDKLYGFKNFADKIFVADAPIFVKTDSFAYCIFLSCTVDLKSNCCLLCNKSLSIKAQNKALLVTHLND